ncbi:MAG: sulfatase-like hydrolase/transferase, partial [Pseudomonadota bacterium]
MLQFVAEQLVQSNSASRPPQGAMMNSRAFSSHIPLAALLAALVALFGCSSNPWSRVTAWQGVQSNVDGKDTGRIAVDAAAPSQPNIVFILIDDLGYTDIGAYGGNVDTPNIDRLAQEALRFSNAHVYPSCAPTRAGLLTGKDPHWVGLGSQNGVAPPGVSEETFGYKGSLEGEFIGLAQVLANAGYQTYHSGKWHLGREKHQSPEALGFQLSFSMVDGAASHLSDRAGVSPSINPPDGKATYSLHGDIVADLHSNFYSTVDFTERLIDMIDSGQAESDDQPFFGYLAYTAVHDPMHAPDDLILKYADRFTSGYQALKEDRIRGLVKKGLVADASVVTRWLSDTPKWSELTEHQKRDMSARMSVYSAMIDVIDQQIGVLIDYLKATDEFENSLIVVASDNGAATLPKTFYASNADERSWQETIYPRSNVADYGRPGSFVSLGTYNAQAVSGPYFGFKSNLHEGGTRTPMIVKTPRSQRTGVVHNFIHITDFYPTFAELARADTSDQKNLIG